jgi:hypothetical protein
MRTVADGGSEDGGGTAANTAAIPRNLVSFSGMPSDDFRSENRLGICAVMKFSLEFRQLTFTHNPTVLYFSEVLCSVVSSVNRSRSGYFWQQEMTTAQRPVLGFLLFSAISFPFCVAIHAFIRLNLDNPYTIVHTAISRLFYYSK